MLWPANQDYIVHMNASQTYLLVNDAALSASFKIRWISHVSNVVKSDCPSSVTWDIQQGRWLRRPAPWHSRLSFCLWGWHPKWALVGIPAVKRSIQFLLKCPGKQ